jgi:hypothetical protein
MYVLSLSQSQLGRPVKKARYYIFNIHRVYTIVYYPTRTPVVYAIPVPVEIYFNVNEPASVLYNLDQLHTHNDFWLTAFKKELWHVVLLLCNDREKEHELLGNGR